MGDCLPTGKPSRYVTSHPGQLSLAKASVGRSNEYQRKSEEYSEENVTAVSELVLSQYDQLQINRLTH